MILKKIFLSWWIGNNSKNENPVKMVNIVEKSSILITKKKVKDFHVC